MAEIRVPLPSGETAVIGGVPDNLTQEDAFEILRSERPDILKAFETKTGQSGPVGAADIPKTVGSGAVRGAANVAGLGGDVQSVASGISSALGGPELPITGQTSQEIIDALSARGGMLGNLASYRSPTLPGRMLSRGVEEAANPINYAPGLGQVARGVGVGRTLAREGLSALGAGAGAELGAESDIPGAEFAGGMTGSVIGGYPMGRLGKVLANRWERGLPTSQEIIDEANVNRAALETMADPFNPVRVNPSRSSRLAQDIRDDLEKAGIFQADEPKIFKQLNRMMPRRLAGKLGAVQVGPSAMEVNTLRERLMEIADKYPDRDWRQVNLRGRIDEISRMLTGMGKGRYPTLSADFVPTANAARKNEAAGRLSSVVRQVGLRSAADAEVSPPFVGNNVSDIIKRRLVTLRYGNAGLKMTPDERELIDAIVQPDGVERALKLAAKQGPRSIAGHFIGTVASHGISLASDLLGRYFSRANVSEKMEAFDTWVRRNAPAAAGYPEPPVRPRGAMSGALLRATTDALAPSQGDALEPGGGQLP